MVDIVTAPVAGSMILAAVLLKLGGYGLLRVSSIFFFFKNFIQVLIWISCFIMVIVGSKE